MNIISPVLDNMDSSYSDDLYARSTNFSINFDFGDEVMDAALSKDFNILMLETSVIPNPITKTLDFTIIKRS